MISKDHSILQIQDSEAHFPQDHPHGPQALPPTRGHAQFLLWPHPATSFPISPACKHIDTGSVLCAMAQKCHWAHRCPQPGACPEGKFQPSCRQKANIGTREQILDTFCAVSTELSNLLHSLPSPSQFPWIPWRVPHVQASWQPLS